jgi:integrase
MTLNINYKALINASEAGRYSTDIKGLYFWIKDNGNKYWLMRYAFQGKRHDLSLGAFPDVSIADAKKKATELRQQILSGINPKQRRIEAITPEPEQEIPRFDQFAIEVVQKKKVEWSNPKHAMQWENTLRDYAFPVIGHKSVDQITMQDILEILTPIWEKKTETASRLRGRLEWILAAATTKGLRTGMNPALWRGLLETILPSPKKFQKVKHHEALPYLQLPAFIARLREQDCMSALALEFLILNANRTSEVTDAFRSEVVDGVWIIPANRMKARVEHRVPLCQRSLDILAIATVKQPDSRYFFSIKNRKLSNMAMSMLLERMNVKVTVHGFRSTFRDWVAEMTNHSPETAEMALAHTIVSKVEASYRRGDLLEKRRLLLADWEGYCHRSQENNVIDLRAA